MNTLIKLTLIILSISIPSIANSLRIIRPNVNPKTLRPDQITVLINGYSEQRINVLHSIAESYSAWAPVAAVILLWSNPSTSHQTLKTLTQNISATVIRTPSSSLNHRFYPLDIIHTKSVLICDDDIHPDQISLNFAFTVWKSNPDRIIGFFGRSHTYDISSRRWIYSMDKKKQSIILTKLMIVNVKYLERYWSEEYRESRGVVEEKNNCEDILMNFVVGKEPVMVGAKGGIRDYGDARNDGGEVKEVGLSSRRKEHRKRRGECIMEFHGLLGKMPLKYSYGIVVDHGGEQGLCYKNGKHQLCDQD